LISRAVGIKHLRHFALFGLHGQGPDEFYSLFGYLI
jgi:hypothetical protein